MISKIKLIKTYPNSPPLNTEYIYNEKYNAFYSENIKYTSGIHLDFVLNNLEYYEIIYEPKFKVGDFVTNGVIEGFIIDFSKSLINNFQYRVECEGLLIGSETIKGYYWLSEEELKIASDTIHLFDKIYFENDNIWICSKNGRKPPKQITIKAYIKYIEGNSIQHFEIFKTEVEAKEWFELNEKKYSLKDVLKVMKLAEDKIRYKSKEYSNSQSYIDDQMPQEIPNEL